jgi:hypothetical protein
MRTMVNDGVRSSIEALGLAGKAHVNDGHKKVSGTFSDTKTAAWFRRG